MAVTQGAWDEARAWDAAFPWDGLVGTTAGGGSGGTGRSTSWDVEPWDPWEEERQHQLDEQINDLLFAADDDLWLIAQVSRQRRGLS